MHDMMIDDETMPTDWIKNQWQFNHTLVFILFLLSCMQIAWKHDENKKKQLVMI